MYEMATGKLPFVADSPVTVAIMQVKNRPKPPRELNAQLPIGLEQIIMGAMEKNPDNRFQSAAQMLRHIAQVKKNPKTVFKMPKAEPSVDISVGTQQNSPSNVKKLTPPKRASRSMFPVISGVTSAFLIVLVVSVFVLFFRISDSGASQNRNQITVQKFVGAIYSEELEAQLESTYYDVEVEYIYDANYDRHVIVAQDPLPGEKRIVIEGNQLCNLKLTVCWGAATCELPDFSYDDSRDAVIKLRSLGLIPNEIREEHEYISEGYVIRTNPEAGTTLDVGDSVTLYVSSGQNIEYVATPDFYKCDEGAVMKMLSWSGLELGEVTFEHNDEVNKGCVITQSKAATLQIPKGTKIDFVMSLGPDMTIPDTSEVTSIADEG